MNENLEKKYKCRYCSKQVQNLAQHIINLHPTILEKLEENLDLTPPPPNLQTPTISHQRGNADIGSLIREKLDLMLNIKIIEMLSKSPNTTIQEISQAINPPQQTNLKDIVELHNLIYPEREEMPVIETGNQWVDIAQQALPIVKDMLQSRKPKQESDLNVRGGEKTNTGILKPIQLEITRDTRKSSNASEKPGITSASEQQDNREHNSA
jgi:hypothetical protein